MKPVPLIGENIEIDLDFAQQIIDAVTDLFKDLIAQPVTQFLKDVIEGVVWLLTYTPAPSVPNGYIFGRPTNSFWPQIYDWYWGTAVPVGLLILFLSYFVTQFAGTWGISSQTRQRGMKKNILNGIFLIPGSWYLVSLLLQFAQAITYLFSSNITIGQNIDELLKGGIAASSIMIALGGSFNFLIIAVAVILNVLRIFALPILIASVPIFLGFQYGQVPVLGSVGRKITSKIPVIAFMSLPTAISLQLSSYLLEDGSLKGFSGLNSEVAVSLVESVVFLIPALFGIVVPVLMYNTSLYSMGGMAATRMLGSTMSPAGSADKSRKERTVGRATTAAKSPGIAQKKTEEMGSQVSDWVSDTAGSLKETKQAFADATYENDSLNSMPDMNVDYDFDTSIDSDSSEPLQDEKPNGEYVWSDSEPNWEYGDQSFADDDSDALSPDEILDEDPWGETTEGPPGTDFVGDGEDLDWERVHEMDDGQESPEDELPGPSKLDAEDFDGALEEPPRPDTVDSEPKEVEPMSDAVEESAPDEAAEYARGAAPDSETEATQQDDASASNRRTTTTQANRRSSTSGTRRNNSNGTRRSSTSNATQDSSSNQSSTQQDSTSTRKANTNRRRKSSNQEQNTGQSNRRRKSSNQGQDTGRSTSSSSGTGRNTRSTEPNTNTGGPSQRGSGNSRTTPTDSQTEPSSSSREATPFDEEVDDDEVIELDRDSFSVDDVAEPNVRDNPQGTTDTSTPNERDNYRDDNY